MIYGDVLGDSGRSVIRGVPEMRDGSREFGRSGWYRFGVPFWEDLQ